MRYIMCFSIVIILGTLLICCSTQSDTANFRHLKEFMEQDRYAFAIAQVLSGQDPSEEEFVTNNEKEYLQKVIFVIPEKPGYLRCSYTVLDPKTCLVRFHHYNSDNSFFTKEDVVLQKEEFWSPIKNLAAHHAHKRTFPKNTRIMANISNPEKYMKKEK